MTTEKALREALQALVDAEDWRRRMPRSGADHMQCDVALKKAWIGARAALSLPETVGEPVAQRRFVGVGHLERTGYIPAGSAAERAALSQPVAWESQRFDCNYDGDITRCDKDCAQIGACKRRTQAAGKAVENLPASLRSPFNACMFKEQCIQQAEKVAAPPSQPAQGMVMVPVEPTPEMLKAGYPPDSEEAQSWGLAEVYRAMLAAAPAAPTNGEGA